MGTINKDIIYCTSNYDLFKHLEGNRDVKNPRKNKIVNSIKERGYLNNPIIVNENMEIIDGQGRLEALKELNLPVRYVFAEGAGIEDCILLNVNKANWSTADYVNCYSDIGDENYKNFKLLKAQFPKLSYEELFGVVANKITSHGGVARTIKTGDLICSADHVKKARDTLSWLTDLDITILNIHGSNRVIRTALAWIITNTKVNRKRLKKVLEEKYPLINPVVDARPTIFFADISDIYNKGLSPKNCIYFDTEYKKWAKEEENK